MKFFLFFLFLLASLLVFSQNENPIAIIRGSVNSSTNGEKLIGASVTIQETSQITFTDIDGSFSFEVSPGEYTLNISYVNYDDTKIENIKAKPSEVTLLQEILLVKSKSENLKEVVIVSSGSRNTESALLTTKRKSAALIDGISAAKLRSTGDGNAVEAARRVTGVTVERGKYVYVRGLGDRYSKTTLNSVEIPGLDPDRNTIQLDIFPTSLINNILISKTFTADLPADFTGGLINIETKDFPLKKIFNVSVGLGYNPSMHFNPNYLSYQGSNTDFLGFDDGLRTLPAVGQRSTIPSPLSLNTYSQEQVSNFINGFSPNLEAQRQTSLLDHGFSVTIGDQLSLKRGRRNKLGYIFSVSYKSDYRYYNDVTYGEFQKIDDPSNYNFIYSTIQRGELGERAVTLGTIAGLAYKTGLSKYRISLTHLQSGMSKAGKFHIDNNPAAVGQSGFFALSDNLEYNQRSLSNVLLEGTHVVRDKQWEIGWKAATTYSISEDPDIRKTALTIEAGDTFFNAGAGGLPSRIWRSLNEINANAKIDITKKYRIFNDNAKLMFGFNQVYKLRNYEIIGLTLQFFGDQVLGNDITASGVLLPENIYPNGPNNIYYQTNNTARENPNQYSSNISNTALYVSTEFTMMKKLKSIIGIRAENYIQRHTGRNQGATLVLDNDIVLNGLDFFPSGNFIYQIQDNQNVRFGYTRTIARPSFKELSFAQIIDPLTNRIFNGSLLPQGNPDSDDYFDGTLVATKINNFDIRWEYFMYEEQLISISVFYKLFDNPIELVRIPIAQTSAEFQPRNVGRGITYGLEFEFKKNLGFISRDLNKLYISGNFTYVESRIDITQIEFNSRLAYEKRGENIQNFRNMAGQSPYVINTGLSYEARGSRVNGGIFYNVKGPTLLIVGVGVFPDIYSEPFHSLNANANIKLGSSGKSSLTFKVTNILGDRQESYYRAYRARKEIFSSINPGTELSLGFNYSF